MKTKVIIITFVILILGLGVYFYVRNYNGKKIYEGLSDRAKEFLNERKKKGLIDYSSLLAKGGNKVDENFRKKARINECFNFIIPFTITNTYSQGQCSNYFSFEQPRGSIVAFLENNSVQSLDDNSGVIFRRLNKDKYKESSETINNRVFLIFRKIDQLEGYEQTAFYLQEGGKVFTVTLTLNQSQEQAEETLNSMLSSLVIY